MSENTLFDMEPSPHIGRPMLSVLPVSVLELEPETSTQRRSDGDHDTQSSRNEYSHFPSTVGDLCFQLYLRDAQRVFDPFAGWGERGSLARSYGKNYLGVDCSREAIAFAENRYHVHNVQGDSRTYPPPPFDGLLTCPPYWNLEKYQGEGLDKAKTWGEFVDDLWLVFKASYDVSRPGAKFCIMTGDWRDAGIYYDLSFQVQRIFDRLGAETIDQVIVSRRTISKVKIMIPQAVRLGYTVKVHETLNVFQKPMRVRACSSVFDTGVNR